MWAVDRYNSTLRSWSPYMVSIFRIMVALLFMQHGLAKFIGFPVPPPGGNYPAMLSLIWFAGAIEVIGGALLALGLFSRPAAFIMSGEMAVAYFYTGRMFRSFFPAANMGTLEIMYCFAFLLLVFIGPGPWSLDAKRTDNP